MGRGKSTGKSKRGKEVAENAVESNAFNGGPASVEVESVVGPSPPRASLTVDDTDDVEEVEGAAGDDGSSSAVEKMGSTAAASVVLAEEEDPEVPVGDGSEKDEAEEAGNGDGPSLDEESSSSISSADQESSSSNSSVDEESSSSTVEEDDFSARTMPVAQLTTESDEHDEDVEENDGPKKELDVEEEYEEANDEVSGEGGDGPSAAVGGADEEAALLRVIARESVSTDDDAAMAEDSNTSSAVEEEVDQAASTLLPDQEEESVVADAAETREPSPVAEEAIGAEDISAVAEAEVGEALKEEDSSNVVEKFVEPVTESAAVKEKQEEEDTVSQTVEPATEVDEASTPLPDQEEESVVADAAETREPESPSPVGEEETGAEDMSAVVPLSEAEVGEALKEDSSNVEETEAAAVEEKQDDEETVPPTVEPATGAAAVEEKQDEEETVPQTTKAEQSLAEETQLLQAVTSAAEPAFDVTGVKEEVAPEVKPLATAEVGNVSKESEVAEAEQAVIPPGLAVESRGASSSLLEELRKLSESRSLRVESSVSEEAKPAVVAESAPKEESSEKADESIVTDTKYVVERAASNDLLAELEKLANARKEKKASEEAASVSSEAIDQSTEKEEGTSAPQELVVDQKVVDVGELVTAKSLDELKELTYDFHMQGRPESDAPEVQSALAVASEPAEHKSTDSSSSASAVAEKLSPEVAEVQISEEVKLEESEGATALKALSKDDISNEVADDSAAVPSSANLYTALKAVDDDLPALKSENGNAETGNVQFKQPGFSAVDFTGEDGDSDADAEDEDEENEDNDDEDDDDEDDTDMDTAKALAELANAVGKSGTGSDSGNKPSMGAAGPSLPSLPQRPAVRKTAAASALDTAGRITARPSAAPSTQLTTTNDENANGESAEGNETREKLQNIRVKFLRLAHRLGQSPQNVVVAQVLYRLGLAESLRGGSAPNRTGAFSFDRANALAEEQEAANQEEELDFACTILVLGKTGVGKSATINSIFDDRKSVTSAFKPSTTKVQEIVGTVHGIKVRVIDTPGLLPSVADQQHNERIMGQVKKHIKKQSPDIVLYFDRLDMQSRDYGDLPLLRTITDLFGAAVWFNAIVVLTHASSAPPDGPNGVPLSYEMFVAQRSHVVQQTIRQAAGDMRLMNPVSLVENHPACRTNRNGQRVLPNGQIWKPQLLLLCFASKILAEANSLLKLQETATPGRPFGQRSRVPPLPFLLSSLLQSRAQLKLPDEQVGESDESDDDEEEDDSDADDYDELPPFRPLSKEELEELSKEQRQDYMDELADRERLFQKKQYREEMRRRKEMKKRAAQMSKEELAQPDDADDEAGKAAAVPVPMPDMALPPSFDSDNPTHRYRYLETANQWLVRPVLETHGWDHDAGYDGFNVEKMFVVKDKIPASISGQVTKDKKEAQVNFEAAASVKHGEGKVTLTGFDIQTIGKDLAYTLRAETRFNNFRRNKTTAGLTCTVLNDTIAAGVKLEDRVLIGKRIKMVVNGGVLTGKGDKAFGGSLEATLRGKEYPLSRTLSTLGLSVMDWHGDLAIGGNLQSQFMVGKTMLVGRANLNNRGSGQVSIRASSSEQLQMVLIGIVPILRSLINCRFGFGQPSQ